MVRRTEYLFYKPYFLIISLVATSIILGILYFVAPEFKKKMETEISKLIIDETSNIANNTKSLILSRAGKNDVLEMFFKDEHFRQDIENVLSLLITKNIKYAYIVYKDPQQKFRFLADGSKENKAFLNQKFDVFNPQWYKVYKEKRDIVIKQSKLKTLWITYLSPIVQNGKVKAILAIDFSVSKLLQINRLIDNIRTFLFTFIVISLGLLGFVLYQFYKYSTLKKKTFVDPLTGVYNRNYLNEINHYIDLNLYSVALIDLDNFKIINDTYGHDIGDLILKVTAKRIKETLGNGDNIVIRYGGEEFLVFIRKDKYNPIRVLEELRISISDYPIAINETERLRVTVSIGLYIDTEKARSLEQAIKTADVALYRAKREGKNRLMVYTEAAKYGLYTVNDVKEAIEENRVFCEYQPIVDIKTGEIIHYEALVRLKDRNGKTIYPNQFLFEIKGTFMYAKLTQRVIEINYKILKNDPTIKIAINLSAEDVVNQTILDLLRYVARDKNVANRLIIEILETEEITNYNLFKDFVKEIKELRYKIAIDDFGSGYSNFTQLVHLKVDYLKIDASLIREILNNETVYLTVKTINDFAKNIGAKTIAEFVSSREIFEEVKKIGVNYAQGFYISKPMSYEKIGKITINVG